ncbi:class I adenylate-forming enzyme family protein [Streptomyces sp. NPDC059255]|uniref:class I adenylate-forming enzyme family protein n=1 Tax=Streptomyces sp. NPDC059255 TaxID=3346793 RepID=UPI0036872EBB
MSESSSTAHAATTAAGTLWAAAQVHPDRICVTEVDRPDGVLSYAGLRDRVAATAGGLRALGAGPGDRLALLLPNCVEYVETFLGALAAGLVVVPLNIRLLRTDYAHMLSDSGSRVLVTTGAFLDRLPEAKGLPGLTVVRTDTVGPGSLRALRSTGEPAAEPVAAHGHDAASLMYTSGTTGLPKAVVLTHHAWRSVAETALRVLDFGPDEVILHAAPLTHGSGFLLLPTLMTGGHSLLAGSYDATRTATLFDEAGVTGLFMVPSMIRMLLDALPAGYTPPPALRRVYYAGSPIDPETLREAADVLDGRLVQSFAQMESPMFFTVLDQADHRRAARDPRLPLVRSAGRVLPGVTLVVVDGTGAPLPPGRAGEILARAPQTMAGYWNRPGESAAALADGWLHTGDIGFLDERGYLFLVDRKKDMIVTGGSNVYAREVEEVLLRLAGVRDAAVVGLPHRIWGEAVTAVLVPEPDRTPPADEEIVAGCRASLAGYRVPKQVVWVDELPRNAYGKVLKRELRERLSAEHLYRVDSAGNP